MSTTTITSLAQEITTLLEYTEARDATHMVIQSSSVSHNPYRDLLNSVRSDLIHLDNEKKQRIIYSINSYIKREESSEENPELQSLLKRILEVVKTYQTEGAILYSPEANHSIIPMNPKELKCSRKLVFDSVTSIDAFLDGNAHH